LKNNYHDIYEMFRYWDESDEEIEGTYQGKNMRD